MDDGTVNTLEEITIKLSQDVTLGDRNKLHESDIYISEKVIYPDGKIPSFEYYAICKTIEHQHIVNALNISK